MDPRRIFDGVPYRQPRHKEGTENALPSWSKANKDDLQSEERCEKPKEKEKDKKDRSRTTNRANDKENARPPAGSPKANLEREKSRSSAVLGLSRLGTKRHGRSQSQSQSQSKENLPSEKGSSQNRKQGGIQIPSLLGLGALSPTSPVKYTAPKMVRPAASMTFKSKDKENQVLRKSSSVHLKEASSGSLRRKPLGPRNPSPPSSPAINPLPGPFTPGKANEDVPTRRVLGDLTRVNQEDRENADISTSSNVSEVLDRMREWERERQRLRELEHMEECCTEETEEERTHESVFHEEMEMRRDMERERMLEIELDRQREEAEAEKVRQMEMQREVKLEKERARDLQSYQQSLARMSLRRRSTSTSLDSILPTPLSPLVEGKDPPYLILAIPLTQPLY